MPRRQPTAGAFFYTVRGARRLDWPIGLDPRGQARHRERSPLTAWIGSRNFGLAQESKASACCTNCCRVQGVSSA
jgi:hypothetical protein